MEYIRLVGKMGSGGGEISISPEKGIVILAVVVAAIIIGTLLSRNGR